MAMDIMKKIKDRKNQIAFAGSYIIYGITFGLTFKALVMETAIGGDFLSPGEILTVVFSVYHNYISQGMLFEAVVIYPLIVSILVFFGIKKILEKYKM